ncbi:MAG: hypothetical protein ABR956_08910 [Terracidiphilus sp.]|jgi:hypothetical protein
MPKSALKFFAFIFLFSTAICAHGQNAMVILNESGFPVADSEAVSVTALQEAFPGASFVTAAELGGALETAGLLVMPYGSAYPEAAWPAILRYLDRGGDLIVLGGKPFTRAAFQTVAGWQLRAPSVANSYELFMADYQQTPGSSGLRFETNPEVQLELPEFAWKRAFSPVIRLSVISLFPNEIGSTGSDDAELTTLAWGSQGAHHRAAPAILIDHYQHRFAGGRWIFVACDPEAHGFDNVRLLSALRTIAVRRQDRFTFRPRLPLFLPGEALEFSFQPAGDGKPQAGDTLKITTSAEEGGTVRTFNVPADPAQTITLPAEVAQGKGLHTVEATLMRGGAPVWGYKSGFWMRDWEYLQSGPKLTVGSDYFNLDGKPLPVVGTTYMASDVDRFYFDKPNAYVWNRDMAQIYAAGLNMIRSGIWTGWSFVTKPDGTVTEDGLRTIEAFLMTARHNHLPVQFNLFAFVPDTFGGEYAYLDPAGLTAQDRYVRSLAERFHDVPFLAWDLINEPSANVNAWKTVPQGGAFEYAAWRAWLKKKYPDQAALLAAWSEPSLGMGRALQSKPTATSPAVAPADPFALPDAGAFAYDGVRFGNNPLKVYDYFLFTQSVFTDWAARQRATIRAAGSNQLITAGQDEAGVSQRLSPAFFSPQVDFTAIHSWWDFDGILWAALASKLPGKPVLTQETGEMRRLMQDNHLRLTPEEEGWQLERKLAISFAQGAGALEWIWNVNAKMANENENTIGAIRPDGTEKPEADVLAGFAKFAAASPASFTSIEPPQVTLVASQSLLYTGMNEMALAVQKKALRALAYYDRTPARMLPENLLDEIGDPKLVILPAPQALTQAAWQRLLDYVARGGCLLVSGPVSRDEHWQLVDRLTPLHVQASLANLGTRQSTMHLPGQGEPLQPSYPAQVQQGPIEVLRFADGDSVEEVAHGRGKILWASDPVEFAENYEPAAALYAYALKKAGVEPAFRQVHPLSPGVLALPTVLSDAVLYSFSSESLDDADVDIEDALTGAHLHFRLASQRGAVVLLSRPEGKVLASYGIELSPTAR